MIKDNSFVKYCVIELILIALCLILKNGFYSEKEIVQFSIYDMRLDNYGRIDRDTHEIVLTNANEEHVLRYGVKFNFEVKNPKMNKKYSFALKENKEGETYIYNVYLNGELIQSNYSGENDIVWKKYFYYYQEHFEKIEVLIRGEGDYKIECVATVERNGKIKEYKCSRVISVKYE